MKKIPLTQGLFAIVSNQDYGRISKLRWHVAKRKRGIYAAHTGYDQKTQKPTVVLMHRFIMNASKGIEVDHRDRNGLHNFRRNLRLCTRFQNNGNRISTPHSSIYKGVSFEKWTERWESCIQIDGKKTRLGRFDSQIEAALAYNKAAKKAFGKFALVNKI